VAYSLSRGDGSVSFEDGGHKAAAGRGGVFWRLAKDGRRGGLMAADVAGDMCEAALRLFGM